MPARASFNVGERSWLFARGAYVFEVVLMVFSLRDEAQLLSVGMPPLGGVLSACRVGATTCVDESCIAVS
jgi:hypothetical protein